MKKPIKIEQTEKRYKVLKYIMAKSAHEALKKERRYRPDDVLVDEKWKEEHSNQLSSAIGFTAEPDYYY